VAEAAGGLPLIAYHYPTVSAPGIPVERLADLPIDGLKDSSGEPERLLEELALEPALPVYVGSATVLLMAGLLGAQGAILALANAEPALCAQAFGGDPDAQRRLLGAHRRSKTRFPAGLKALVAERWGTSATTRLA
jgi:4-hydroxy-tetrahydrodipicolinate synthase